MTALRQEVIDLAQKAIPEENLQQVRDILITFVKPDVKNEPRLNRKPGALANDDFYIAPDFDTCFGDDPAAFGLEDYM